MKKILLGLLGLLMVVGLIGIVDAAPDINVSLDLPIDSSTATATTIAFTCSAVNGTDHNYSSITIWSNYGGSWTNLTTNATGELGSGGGITWTSGTLTDFDSKVWNCLACNDSVAAYDDWDDTNCSYASANYTITQDDTAPVFVWTAYGAESTKGTNNATIEGSSAYLTATTDDSASVCKFSTTDEAYASMSGSQPYEGSFDSSGSSPYVSIFGLSDGSKTYYATCQDDHGNEMASRVSMTFSVDGGLSREQAQAGGVTAKQASPLLIVIILAGAYLYFKDK